MTVSVVIPHYGHHSLLEACLAALRAHTDRTVEVVVVDNGTGCDIAADVIVRNEDNLGFAVACNQGAAAAAGDTIVFLNNDTEVHAGWLEPLTARLAAGAGIVGALLLYPDGNVQHAGIHLYHNTSDVLTAANRREAHPAGEVEAVTGACLAIHRDVFFALGGFDGGYHNGYEDVDLCLTARAAGHTVMFEPASRVTHHESASGPDRWVALRENIARLQTKWGSIGVDA